MLRRRSRGVAKFSQHIAGKAIDFFIPGVALEEQRAAALRLQRGGVGYYPASFIHVDVGSIRHWPRMTHEQLARIFSNGKTAHIPNAGIQTADAGSPSPGRGRVAAVPMPRARPGPAIAGEFTLAAASMSPTISTASTPQPAS